MWGNTSCGWCSSSNPVETGINRLYGDWMCSYKHCFVVIEMKGGNVTGL